MAAVIRNSFNVRSGANPLAENLDASVGVSQKANATLLSALSNANTSVRVDLTQNIDPAKPGAQSQAQNAIAGIQAQQQIVNGQIASAFEGIAAAQREITAAVRGAGAEPQQVFDKAPSNDGGAFLIDAAANLKSGGTFVTFMKGISQSTMMADAIGDRQGGVSQKVMAKIEARLVSSSPSPSAQVQAASFGYVQDADAADNAAQTSQFNWGEIFAQHPEAMEAIMYFDASNPESVRQVSPDLADMIANAAQAEDKVTELEGVIAEADRLGTPNYGSVDALYMVQLGGEGNGFVDGLAVSSAHNPMISPDEIAAIAKRSGANAPDKPPALNREDELKQMVEKAANWGTAPTPAGQYA